VTAVIFTYFLLAGEARYRPIKSDVPRGSRWDPISHLTCRRLCWWRYWRL